MSVYPRGESFFLISNWNFFDCSFVSVVFHPIAVHLCKDYGSIFSILSHREARPRIEVFSKPFLLQKHTKKNGVVLVVRGTRKIKI